MGKLAPIDGKQTNWLGLWWHPEYNGFSSCVFSLADIRKFKGQVRLFVRKNKFFQGGKNGRPNYHFCIKDANSNIFQNLEVEDDEDTLQNENEERLYTDEEVRIIINGVFRDAQNGVTDPYDLSPSLYV